jgi:Icc-related predicted phosphoesterase
MKRTMFEIVLIGDVHGEQRRLGRVLRHVAETRPALAVLVGDVGIDPPRFEPARTRDRSRHDASMRAVVTQLRSALGCPVVFVPGNHDMPDPVDDLDGVNCDRTRVEVARLQVAGFGGAGPSRFGFPYEWSEETADAALGELLEDGPRLDLLVSHTPPSDTALDRIHSGRHVGSRAVRRWAVAHRPRLLVCGHIHEAWGVERVDGVTCLNAGALGEPFAEELIWKVAWSEAGPISIRSYRSTGGRRVETREWTGPSVG